MYIIKNSVTGVIVYILYYKNLTFQSTKVIIFTFQFIVSKLLFSLKFLELLKFFLNILLNDAHKLLLTVGKNNFTVIRNVYTNDHIQLISVNVPLLTPAMATNFILVRSSTVGNAYVNNFHFVYTLIDLCINWLKSSGRQSY